MYIVYIDSYHRSYDLIQERYDKPKFDDGSWEKILYSASSSLPLNDALHTKVVDPSELTIDMGM